MRNWTKILIVMMAACMLAGCGGEATPDRNTVSVQKDGTIQQTIVDQFEPEYYDIEELRAMTQAKIAQLGGAEAAVICDSMVAEEGRIVVKMTYQTDTDRKSVV